MICPINKTSIAIQDYISSIAIQDYIRHPILLHPEQTCGECHHLFETRDAECAVVCDEEQIPLGLVMKDRFYRFMGRMYGTSLYFEKYVPRLMETSPMIADISIPPQELIDLTLTRDEASEALKKIQSLINGYEYAAFSNQV